MTDGRSDSYPTTCTALAAVLTFPTLGRQPLSWSPPQAGRDLRGPTDVAQLAALKDYRTVRVVRTGDLYLSVLVPDKSPES
jgi:hypothetical protein